jgi:hypothetical protein
MIRMRKVGLGAVAGVVVVGLVSGYVLARPESKVLRTEAYDVASATPDQLERLARLRIFFGHQSVGGNILGATPDVFAAAGVAAPEIVESEKAVASGPLILHSYIGRNGDPLGKLAEFDRIIRSGVGDSVDVAVFKFCYVDVHEGDDIDALFAAYRDTLAALERDYPDVTFLYLTVPLTTEFGGPFERAKRRVKDLLGRENIFVPAHNVAREELNALIRAEFGDSGRFFDIAAVQSTGADGNRQVRSHGGSVYFAMEDVLASDPGHLNSGGGAIVASAFLATVADAVNSDPVD